MWEIILEIILWLSFMCAHTCIYVHTNTQIQKQIPGFSTQRSDLKNVQWGSKNLTFYWVSIGSAGEGGHMLKTTLENAGSLCFRWGLIHRQMSPMTTGLSISVLTSANSPSLWALGMVQCFSGSIWFPFFSPALWAGDKNHVNLSQQSCCFLWCLWYWVDSDMARCSF